MIAVKIKTVEFLKLNKQAGFVWALNQELSEFETLVKYEHKDGRFLWIIHDAFNQVVQLVEYLDEYGKRYFFDANPKQLKIKF